MTNCIYCGKKEETPKGYKRNFCDKCIKDKEIGIPSSIEKVYLRNYGWESKKRIDELERRVILPYERPNSEGGYYVGRKGENGKIQERVPTY